MAVAAALLLPARPAGARDLEGQAALTWAREELGPASSEYLRQNYFVGFHRQVTLPISYRLSLRFQDDQGTVETAGERTGLRGRSWEPYASLNWRLETFALSAAYRRSEKASRTGLEPWQSSVIERFGTTGWVAPFTDGSVTLAVDRLGYRAPAVDTVDDRLSLNFRYAFERLAVTNENRLQHYEDARTRLWRTSMGPRLAVSWSGGAGDLLSASGVYVIDYFRSQQEVRGSTPTTVATEVQPAMGLYLGDDLPIDTPPMTAVPALVDRAFDVSAGISLGPDGASFQNLGLDMGRSVAVDELRIHLRSALGVPVPFGGPMTWTVYWSVDGLRWTQVDAVTAAFSDDMSAWQVGFTPTTARHFKVVSFGVNTVDTQVTELQAYVHEAFTPNRALVSSTVRQTLGLNLASRPLPKLQLSYSGLVDASAVTVPGSAARWTSDLSNAFNVRAGPFRDLLLGLSLSHLSARQPSNQSQVTAGVAASARYQPVERLTATLEATRSDAWIESTIAVHTATTGASLHGQFGVYESLTASLDAGLNVQEIAGGGSTQYLTAAGHVSSRLTRSLDLELDASAQRILSRVGDTSAQAQVPFIRILTYQRIVAEARYHPSPQLSLVVDGGWLVSEGRGGPIRNVRGSWSPFPGGALVLTFDYVQDVDPLTGSSLRRLVVAPIWRMNPNASLGLSYNLVSGKGPASQESLYLTFTLKS